MDFLAPHNLFWLIPTMGGITALRMLRMRRRNYVVPSLALWRSVSPVQKADTPFERLRRSFLLILQLLCAFLLVLALAGPQFRLPGHAHRSIAIVIDNSAGMRATDAQPTRLAAAEALAASSVLGRMHPGDEACAIALCPEPHVLQGWTAQRGALARALNGTEPTDVTRDLPSGLVAAAGQFGPRQTGTRSIVVCSDGAWPPESDAQMRESAGTIPVDFALLPAVTPRNVGIVALSARPDPLLPGHRRVYVRVFNCSPVPLHAGRLIASLNGKDERVFRVDADAYSDASVSFSVTSPPHDAVLNVALDNVPGDSLESDNHASLILARGGAERVLLVSTRDPSMARALLANPNIALYGCRPEEYSDSTPVGYDLVVFDRFGPTAMPPCNTLIFDAIVPGGPVQLGNGHETRSAGAVVDWQQTDPLLRFADLSGVHMTGQTCVEPVSGARTIASTMTGPLIIAQEAKGRRAVWVACTTENSDFADQAAFPIFMQNALEWLGSGLGVIDSERVGGAISGGDIDSRAKSLAGVYAEGSGPSREWVARSVVSQAATDLRSHAHSAWVSPTESRQTRSRTQRIDVTGLAAAVGLALLLLEWWLYHRMPRKISGARGTNSVAERL